MLDDAWDAAPPAANSLRDQLRAYEKEVSQVYRGGSLASVSKNSTSQSYASGPNNLTVLQVAKGWRMLVNLFDYCKSEIDLEIAAVPQDPQDPGNDKDPAVYARMAQFLNPLLTPVNEYTTDLTQLLLPPVIAPPVPMTQ